MVSDFDASQAVDDLRRVLLPNGAHTMATDVTNQAARDIRNLTLAEYDQLKDALTQRIRDADQELNDVQYLDERIRKLSGYRSADQERTDVAP